MNDVDRRRPDFERNALAWLVVRHFLPADLVLELCDAIVQRWSDGKITLNQLARFDLSTGQAALANLSFRPYATTEPLARTLSQLIQIIVWQGDQTMTSASEEQVHPAGGTAVLADALILSHRDLTGVERWGAQLADVAGVGPIVAAMSVLSAGLSNDAIDIRLIETILKDYDGSLVQALLLKHFGDLAGDNDRWDISEALYRRAGQLVETGNLPGWELLRTSLRAIVDQSFAAAVWITQGPGAAAVLLDALLESRQADGPLASLNASLDAIGAHSAAGDLYGFQRERGSVLLAPQLINTHHPSYALAHALEGRHQDVYRWFWAVLRRQIALGSAISSRDTKAAYARSLIDLLAASLGKNLAADDFLLAVRLLLESGRDRTADAIVWGSNFVAAYVTDSLVEATIRHADRHSGAMLERHRVMISLARGWLKVLPAERTDVAASLMGLLARFAQQPNQANRSAANLSATATKALGIIGTARPEFTVSIAEAVGEIVIARLENAGWHAVMEALDACEPFVQRFSTPTLELVIERILAVIEGRQETTEGSPLLRSALNFLGHDRIIALTRDPNGALGRRLARTIVRLALDTEAEHQRLMYLLRDLEPAVVEDALDQARLKEVVDNLSKKAAEVNSSDAPGCVQALLVAPAVSGVRGVEAAVDGLGKILRSMSEHNGGFASVDAYRPLVLLSMHHEDIARNAGMDGAKLLANITEFQASLHRLWEKATIKPAIFNGFAIPAPTEPNRVIVHNWTFSSLAFAEAIGQHEAMESVLTRAAQNLALRPAIETARAVRVSIDGAPFELTAIAQQPREAFYAALGERLVQLKIVPQEDRSEILVTLIERCLQLGPSGLDAGLFMAGIQHEVRVAGSLSSEGYFARLRENTELLHGLMPLFTRVVTDFDENGNR